MSTEAVTVGLHKERLGEDWRGTHTDIEAVARRENLYVEGTKQHRLLT